MRQCAFGVLSKWWSRETSREKVISPSLRFCIHSIVFLSFYIRRNKRLVEGLAQDLAFNEHVRTKVPSLSRFGLRDGTPVTPEMVQFFQSPFAAVSKGGCPPLSTMDRSTGGPWLIVFLQTDPLSDAHTVTFIVGVKMTLIKWISLQSHCFMWVLSPS